MGVKKVSKLRLLAEIVVVTVAFLLLSVAFALLFFLIDAGFTIDVVLALEEDPSLALVSQLLSVPFAMLATLGVLALFLKNRGLDFAALGLKFPASWSRTMVQGVLLALAVYIVAIGAQLALGKAGYEPRLDDFTVIEGNLPLFLYAITAITWISAALGEEILFRGFMMRNFAGLFGEGRFAWWGAVALQAAVFGAVHLNQGVAGAVPVGLIALVFGVAYLKLGKNLWPLIIAHGLVNTLTFTLIYLGLTDVF